MKAFILILIAPIVISTNASAERYGKDERIFMCESNSEAKFLQKNKKFRIQVVENQWMKITRLHDKAWLKAVNETGAYVFDTAELGKWTRHLSGYMGDVPKDGDFSIAFQIKPGQYQSDDLSCKLARVISEYDPLTSTEKIFDDMFEDINMGNGSADFRRYDIKKFDIDKEWTALKKHRRKGCEWSTADGMADVTKIITDDLDNAKVAETLAALDSEVGITAWIADVSDNDVSCSLTNIWVYVADGTKLELFYDYGD